MNFFDNRAIRHLVATPLGAKVLHNDQNGNGNPSNQLEPFLDESGNTFKSIKKNTRM
jgi:hypothetical protein